MLAGLSSIKWKFEKNVKIPQKMFSLDQSIQKDIALECTVLSPLLSDSFIFEKDKK